MIWLNMVGPLEWQHWFCSIALGRITLNVVMTKVTQQVTTVLFGFSRFELSHTNYKSSEITKKITRTSSICAFSWAALQEKIWVCKCLFLSAWSQSSFSWWPELGWKNIAMDFLPQVHALCLTVFVGILFFHHSHETWDVVSWCSTLSTLASDWSSRQESAGKETHL
jgi:hypothetical protein